MVSLRRRLSSSTKSDWKLIRRRYYSTIHPTLPLLPPESAALNRLTDCPPKLREAFFLALESAVRAFSPSGLPPADTMYGQFMLRTTEAVEQSQHQLNDPDGGRQLFNHLVYCQTLTLLAFASDKSGPNGMGTAAEYIGRVAGRFSDLRINDTKHLSSIREQDIELFEVARRLFWVVFILDRFHASSMSKDILLPLHCGSVSREDNVALGETGYHLARKCFKASKPHLILY